jgi:hypothetical protein
MGFNPTIDIIKEMGVIPEEKLFVSLIRTIDGAEVAFHHCQIPEYRIGDKYLQSGSASGAASEQSHFDLPITVLTSRLKSGQCCNRCYCYCLSLLFSPFTHQ